MEKPIESTYLGIGRIKQGRQSWLDNARARMVSGTRKAVSQTPSAQGTLAVSEIPGLTVPGEFEAWRSLSA